MCPKYVVDIHILRRNDNSRLMGPPIIELEYEQDILDPHIIIGGESIGLQKLTLCERYLQFGHPKNFAKETRNSAETAQSFYRKEEYEIIGKFFAYIAKKPTRQETKICKEQQSRIK